MITPRHERENLVATIHSMISRFFIVCLRGLVRCYQLVFSPYIQPRCRFQPTCSHYAMEALETHGLLVGINLTIKRLARCHPWTDGGIDFVPKPTIDESKHQS